MVIKIFLIRGQGLPVVRSVTKINTQIILEVPYSIRIKYNIKVDLLHQYLYIVTLSLLSLVSRNVYMILLVNHTAGL